jgi:hypothetical protein
VGTRRPRRKSFPNWRSRNLQQQSELFDRHQAGNPNLAIGSGLLLHYPMPVYLWFRKTEDGRPGESVPGR